MLKGKMDKRGRIKIGLFLFVSAILVLSLYLVFAAHIIGPVSGTSFSVNENVEFTYNISINNTDTVAGTMNVTLVSIVLPVGFIFTDTSNGTSNGTVIVANTFNVTSNSSMTTSTVLNWTNASMNSLVNLWASNGLQYFWFNATTSIPGTYTLNISTSNSSHSPINFTTISIRINGITPFAVSQNPTSINRSANTQVNFSITGQSDDTSNVTVVEFSLPMGVTFVSNSNSTNATWSSFINTSSSLRWNLTAGGFKWGTTKNFAFNVTSVEGQNVNISLNVTRDNGGWNASTSSTTTNFAFSGYIKNETGHNVTGANVSIYQFAEQPNGPPKEIFVASALSGNDGSFTLSNINSSADLFLLKMYYRQGSNSTHENASGSVIKVGTILPPFPAMMYYPLPSFDFDDFQGNEFMKPPTLNGTTFYVEDAATINISAINTTAGGWQLFGYEVMEQKAGFPIESNFRTNVSVKQVYVPLNRQYTIMVLREPFTGISGFSFGNGSTCNGQFMNATHCPAPPRSNSTVTPTVAGQVLNVQLNLTVTRVYLSGCIGVSGNLTPIRNVTSIIPRMMPWTGFVPPMKDTGELNLSSTSQLNQSNPPCTMNGQFAWYNISLLNSNYLLEFYAKNTTNSTHDGVAEYVGMLQNVSLSATTTQNVTLGPLAGAYNNATGGDVNATKVTINFVNSTGGLITDDTPHVDLYLRNDSTFGELHYIIEDNQISQGSFVWPIPRNVIAKIKLFPNQAPPTEKTINLSKAVNNITIIQMNEGDGDLGFRKVNSSGQLEEMNVSAFPINMRFIRSTSTCDGINPGSSCVLTAMNNSEFNPLKALVAGKINMEMKLISSNTTITFYNFDMFSAKQPPMESVINDQASSGGSSANQVWQFGSFVPSEVYDYVVIGMPYSDSVINDAGSMNVSIPFLYDENWNVVWNASLGHTTSNITSDIDQYLGNSNNRSYNSTGYRNFLTTAGRTCSKTDSNLNGTTNTEYCYINTTSNMIYIRVPHFSGVAPNVIGNAPSSGSSSSSSSSSSDGGAGAAGSIHDVSESQFNSGYSRDLNVNDKLRFTLNSEYHFVELTGVTVAAATVKVSSTPQTSTFAIGETKKFEVTGDNFYDVAVTLNSIAATNGTNKANIKIIATSDPVASTPSSEQEEEAGSPITGAAVSETEEVTKEGKSYWWLWAIVAVLIAAVVIVILYRLRQ